MLTDVSAVEMNREVLRGWVGDHPEIAERLLRVLARAPAPHHDLSDLIFTDITARVATQLLRLAPHFGAQEDGEMRVTHDLTHEEEEIAQLIRAFRKTVNKVLNGFTQRAGLRWTATAF